MVTVLLVSFVTATVSTGVAIPLLRAAGVLDVPNFRSSHKSPVPRGGGVCVLTAVTLAIAIHGASPQAVVITATGVAAGALGLVDDIHALPVTVRLAIQSALSLVAAAWLTTQHAMGTGLMVAGACAGALWLVGYLNAFNFMDGINGISGLSAVVATGWFVWLGLDYDQPALTLVSLAIAGASSGFLPWNFPRATIFLGDAGSYGIGMLIGCIGLAAVLHGIPFWLVAAPLTIYLADTVWALLKRLVRGDPWRSPHREHVYQRLVDFGWSHTAGALLVSMGALGLAVLSTLLPVAWFGAVTCIVIVGYLGLPAVSARAEGEPWK